MRVIIHTPSKYLPIMFHLPLGQRFVDLITCGAGNRDLKHHVHAFMSSTRVGSVCGLACLTVGE